MKNPTFRGGSRKTNKEGGLPKKGGLVQFANLRGGFAGKRGGVLEGEGIYTPMHTMKYECNSAEKCM